MITVTRRQFLFGAALATPAVVLTAAGLASRNPFLPPVPAVPAQAAFRSYGINTHLSFLRQGNVWENTDAATQWILDLGVGAVRQALPSAAHGRSGVKQGMRKLNDAGVRWCCPILTPDDCPTLPAARRAVNQQLNWLAANMDLSLLDSLPGLNEPNSAGKGLAAWPNITRFAQQALYEETRKRSSFDHVLVQGPPLNMKGGPKEIVPDVEALGDLSAWLDRGDAHLYPGDDDPEFAIDDRLTLLAPINPGKPVCVSEGGYSTSVDRGYTGGAALVSEQAAAMYGPKQVLVHAMHGRPFFYYELLDEAPPFKDTEGSIREAGFGLVRTPTTAPDSWTAKPGFEAIRRLLALMRDVGPPPAVPLWTQVTAATPDLRTALLHRSDGTWLLALWRAVDLYEWDRAKLTGRDLSVEPQAVHVALDGARLVVLHQPSLNAAATDAFVGQDFTLAIGPDLQILEIE